MGQVDSVEVADGHHAGGRGSDEFLKVCDDAHKRKEKRNSKLETGKSKLAATLEFPVSIFGYLISRQNET
jgi:hypothetical protein